MAVCKLSLAQHWKGLHLRSWCIVELVKIYNYKIIIDSDAPLESFLHKDLIFKVRSICVRIWFDYVYRIGKTCGYEIQGHNAWYRGSWTAVSGLWWLCTKLLSCMFFGLLVVFQKKDNIWQYQSISCYFQTHFLTMYQLIGGSSPHPLRLVLWPSYLVRGPDWGDQGLQWGPHSLTGVEWVWLAV